MVSFTLSYKGALADNNVLDMYDAARGLMGFQRSLALTTHLALNGEIITHATALRGATIISSTPEEGSWKVTAVVIAGLYASVTAPKETPFGHLVYSIYDYVVNATLGFHVDYNQSLAQQYENQLQKNKITEEKLDSLMEKTEYAISDMHRPIVASESATEAKINANFEIGLPKRVGPTLSRLTYDYVATTVRRDEETEIEGVVSSFNMNTYKGRIFSFSEQRPIPFELSETARSRGALLLVTTSLRANASNRFDRSAGVVMTVRRFETSTGRLKSLIVHDVKNI